jgi:DNA polymerase III subunit delta
MAEQPSVVLYWGEDEFLLRLAAHELLDRRGVHATEVAGSDWQGGETSDLATPSLWGEARALLINQYQSLPEAGANEVLAYVRSPSPDALCVLTLVTRGKRGPALVKAVQEGGGAAKQIAMRRADLTKWLVDRSRARGMKLEGPAAAELMKTLGDDPSTLDSALEQLASAFAGRSIGPEQVRAQFQGMGEQKVWDLCDQAFAGRLPKALVVLRSLLQAREDSLLITGGIAARVRDLIRVRSLSGSLSTSEAASAAGVRFDWQLRRYREQAARFTADELADLQGRVVDADRAIKGGTSGEVVLTGLVGAMAGVREAALSVPPRVGR